MIQTGGLAGRTARLMVLAVTLVGTLVGCGLGEGIHTARDPGLSTSRFRYEYELIPDAVVMREDTEPRWQLGRYVFVPGADRVLVVSRITSWSETATKKQRETGDIPDMKDQMLERLWITIPQGTPVGEELDLHALSYRFQVSYDQGMVADAQFARPFRVLGNVRVLEEAQDHVIVRLRLRVTTDLTTAWQVFEDNLRVPITHTGIHARQAAPDAVVYWVYRQGEAPTTGLTPAELDLPTPPVTPPMPTDKPAEPDADQASPAPDDAEAQVTGEPGETAGRWYFRSPAWEAFLQLDEDGTFAHAASRPHSQVAVVKGDWRVRAGFLILHIKSFQVGGSSVMHLRQENPYAMLRLEWLNPNTLRLDGDLPVPGALRGGYVLHRANFADLKFLPPTPYIPESEMPPLIGRPPEVAPEAAPESSPEPSPESTPESSPESSSGATPPAFPGTSPQASEPPADATK